MCKYVRFVAASFYFIAFYSVAQLRDVLFGAMKFQSTLYTLSVLQNINIFQRYFHDLSKKYTTIYLCKPYYAHVSKQIILILFK